MLYIYIYCNVTEYNLVLTFFIGGKCTEQNIFIYMLINSLVP